jgi:PAS domain S-box-containing protein
LPDSLDRTVVEQEKQSDLTSAPVSSRARALFDAPDMAGAYLVIRLSAMITLAVAGAVLWLLWGWAGGLLVTLLSLATGTDATLRLRSGEHGKLWFLMVVDITAIGIAMVLSGMPDVIAIAPYTYSVTAAALLLPLTRARWLVLYTVAWLVAILLIDRLPYTIELNEAQALVVGAIGLAVYVGCTVALTSLAARALRTREAVQSELREAGRRLHAVVTGAPVALIALDADGIFTVAEGAGLRVFGAGSDELVGTHARDLFANDYQILALIERGLQTVDPLAEVVQFRDFVFDLRLTPVQHETGTPAGLIGTATDVTARFRAQQELEERGDLEHLIATLSTMLMTTPPDQVDDGVVTALAEIANFAGVERSFVMVQEDRGDRWRVSHEWHREGFEAHAEHYQDIAIRDYPWMLKRLASGRIVSVSSTAALPADAAVLKRQMFDRNIESFCLVPLDVAGQVSGMVGFASDRPAELKRHDLMLLRIVGEMIVAVLERRLAHARLEELVASKDQFVASVSHELRTPLTAVVGLAQELRDRSESFSDDETGQFHELIAEQAADVAGIVEDLLVAARADMGEVAILPEDLDLRGEVEFVLAAVGPKDRERISVEMDHWVGRADRTRVRQILRNLVTNALRYGGPSIVVSSRSTAGHVAIDVRDDGDGVTGADAERIFEPYHHTRQVAGRPPSIGLGLTVARRLARLMDGDLNYERLEGWSQFSLEMPAVADAPARVAGPPADVIPSDVASPYSSTSGPEAVNTTNEVEVATDQLGPDVRVSGFPIRSKARRQA